MVRSLPPKVVVPLPDKVTIDALVVTPEISKVPFAATLEDEAIAPEPVRAKVALPLIVVRH